VVALAAKRAIGVDVERCRSDLDIEGIAGRFFSAREHSKLLGLPLGHRRDAFFRCWTQKEAFIKARGQGLSLPLDCFDVSVWPRNPRCCFKTPADPVEASRWVIRELKIGRDYKAAVAVEGTGWLLRMMWRPALLISR
jgi:4'-phosphopantetheinyl transferase